MPDAPALLSAAPLESLVAHLGGLAARRLGHADQAAIASLRANVMASLPDPDLYVAEDDEAAFVQAHLGDRGETLGLWQGSRLVAYAMIGWPGADAGSGGGDDFASLLRLDAADRAACAQLSSCMVAPEWRGHGLQRALIGARLSMARAQGSSRLLGLVSLHNHASRHNMMACGLAVRWVGHWRGLKRQLLARELDPAALPAASEAALTWVAADDFEAQRRLTEAGAQAAAERPTEGDKAPQLGYADSRAARQPSHRGPS